VHRAAARALRAEAERDKAIAIVKLLAEEPFRVLTRPASLPLVPVARRPQFGANPSHSQT
jgi:hypothetical protein